MSRGNSPTTAIGAVRLTVNGAAIAAAAAAMLAFPPAPQAATRASPPIVIPPAKLPSSPGAEATASAAPASAPAPLDPLLGPLQILHDPHGSGLALYGELSGKAESATGAVLAIFAQRGPFDLQPVSQLLLTDSSDRRAQALFTATVHGAPVTGVAVAALGAPGGDVAILFDDVDAFPASFARLRRALEPGNAAIEIGISDNSAYEADTAMDARADAKWEEAIAALGRGTPIDAGVAQSIIKKLASDTGDRWRVVQPASLR